MDFTESFKRLADMKNNYQEKKLSFLRFLATLALSLIGLLTALHRTNSSLLIVRLAWALTILLFASGLLYLLITVYTLDIKFRKETLTRYSDELLSAYREGREVKPFAAGDEQKVKKYERISYILLGVAILSLSAYAVILAFS
jgi:hypothetical protein